MTHIAVIGAGQAGAALAARLRALGHEGPITLIGAEPFPPYQRPPLSKAYLLGEMTRDRLFLRPRSFYDEHKITLRLGQPVTAIDPAAKILRIGCEAIAWDQLALTTGAAPVRLPESMTGRLSGIHYVRTLSDIDTLAPEFEAGRRVLIVGGGYIGLEAAAVAASKGLKVTLIEAAERILSRVAAPETANYFRDLHARHGVHILEGRSLSALSGRNKVEQAVLEGGETLPVDFVIVGIGVRPETGLAKMAGIVLENGIRTDALGRTSAPNIWAAGDCASFPWGDGRIRLESVPNALDHGEAVAANMLGAGEIYEARPWFWSDQYDVKLQIAGLSTGYERVIVRPGAREDVQSVWYWRGDRLIAVDAMNDPRAYMVAKRLIEAGRSPAPDLIAEPETDLRALLKP